MDNRSIFCKSNFNIYESGDESVALTVTSPPYWKGINYETHLNDNEGEDYRKGDYVGFGKTLDDYFDNLKKSFKEVNRVTMPGGFCAVVIGTTIADKKHIPLPMMFTSMMLDMDWDFHQDIIWNKVTGGVKRAGVFIQHPRMGYFYPNIMTEYILIFRKPGEIRRGLEQEIGIDSLFTKDIANNVWHIAPVPPKHIDHPCPYPEEIARRLILLYSQKGDTVLDNFMGSGQTALPALRHGRRFIGYEIEQKYVDLAFARIENPPPQRPHNLIPKMEKIEIGNT